MFGIGQHPDRRQGSVRAAPAALGVMRILIEKQLADPAAATSSTSRSSAFDGVPAVQGRGAPSSRASSTTGCAATCASWATRRTRSTRCCDAAARRHPISCRRGSRPCARSSALPEAGALAAANKRIVNILRKVRREAAPAVDRARLADGAEHDLYLAFQKLDPVVDDHCARGDFAGALLALAAAKPPSTASSTT